MNIKWLRIDSRLIHGQVANNWVNHVGAGTIIAANDSAAKDDLRKTLLLQVAPGRTKSYVMTVDKTARCYKNPTYKDLDVLMVVESPKDVLRLMDQGVDVTQVNVGGITFKEGMTLISEAVSVSREDVEAFKELDKRGIKLILQQLPNTQASDFMNRLKSKNLV
ncbi:PTS system mannose/fructose/N-acetylgalactosamine-transporter subunit IIB [Sporolactobacillus terrae]|uniref:PTS mannose/fructose/sorbose transporter subunit IIB n=1 Tax=Sporolactobacillus terrae TaxID=269673 RepID=A0ABX5Q491_9BACL|nr:PTS sugar transporter subunit IIB [Sporolactobacillus terrae]QAA21459.1 PTS mannose/fructose/sorbose transporter subunit IIB [Sporolactobacillus terrae]QAA24431.1 PTS mannose/fructose/sorbose transporter subunit IIB [Sporolactobacillus terrae]UAK16259.1 PTS sugar transporter subunit IIB [Sporolactobacillus terrae]